MRKLVSSLVVAVISVVIVISLLFWFTVQPNAVVVENSQINSAIAKSSDVVLKRLKSQFANLKQQSNGAITLSSSELSGLLALIHRSYPFISVNSQFSNGQLTLKGSVTLPWSFYRKYINFSLVINASQQGLDIDSLSMGKLPIPANSFLKISAKVMDWWLDESLATEALNLIQQVVVTNSHITVFYALPADFAFTEDSAGRLLKLRDQMQLFGNIEKTAFYYSKLLNFTQQITREQNELPTFDQFIFYMLYQAANSTDSDEIIEENRAALLALTIYFGPKNIEVLIGDISQLSKAEEKKRQWLASHVVLNHRNDLQKHFIYSVAITLLSDVPMSSTIGELKEFLDSNQGGSGFSFVDLLADKAGTKLAQLTCQNEVSAQRIKQYILTKPEHFNILPHWQGLPEGLTQQQFKQQFQSVDSQHYAHYVQEIKNRIASLPVYQ